MSDGLVITEQVHFGTGRRTRREIRTGTEPPKPAGRVPRVAKLMALAIRFEGLVRHGVLPTMQSWRGSGT